uniref:RING-type domain-containing protein n=1 Tax=Denticeps clupeoides TaxID=299321 RepID=A0AAY4ALG7_9TELE
MSEIPGVVQEENPGLGDQGEVECPICYQEYNQSSKCPRMLECLHVFCTECLQRIRHATPCSPDPENPASISCPLCRHPTQLETGDAHALPPSSKTLSRLPPVSFRMPISVATRLATTVTQRVVVSLESREARFIILPTVSLRVEQMSEEDGRRRRTAATAGLEGEAEAFRQQRKNLLCVQLLAVIFWLMFVFTCVIMVVFVVSCRFV